MRLAGRVRQDRARRRGRPHRHRRGDRRRRHRRPGLRQPPAAAAGRRPGADGEPGRGACGGDREGQDLRRPQPVRRGHAPRPAARSCSPTSAARTGASRALPSARSRRRPSTCCPTPSSRSASRRPRPQHNNGNEIVSVAALCRYMQQQAEEAGAYMLTETAATQLIVDDGAVKGIRSGDKGRGKDGEPLGNFEPGTDIARAGHGPGRGLLGSPDRRRDPRVRPGRGPRAAGLGARVSRRCGRSPSHWTG